MEIFHHLSKISYNIIVGLSQALTLSHCCHEGFDKPLFLVLDNALMKGFIEHGIAYNWISERGGIQEEWVSH